MTWTRWAAPGRVLDPLDCDTQLYMAEGSRDDLGVYANHQLQMAEPPSSTWRPGPESTIRPACFDGTATCFWEPPTKAGCHTRSPLPLTENHPPPPGGSNR